MQLPSIEKIEMTGSQATTQAGAGITIFSGLTLNEVGVLVGILVGLAGICLQWYFLSRRDKREREAHEFKMRPIKGEKNGSKTPRS